jgi:glyoxylase-like metal-dependent hydrolase (beta-lactamase superfamily II)
MSVRFDRLPPLSRRSFFEAAAAAVAAGHLPNILAKTAAPKGAVTDARPRRISENLFVLEDTCNVYLIRDGDRGVLIDFGSGMMLKHVGDLGVRKIDWILHAHHHRDQAQGNGLGGRAG